jgi:hypothetical protein
VTISEREQLGARRLQRARLCNAKNAIRSANVFLATPPMGRVGQHLCEQRRTELVGDDALRLRRQIQQIIRLKD